MRPFLPLTPFRRFSKFGYFAGGGRFPTARFRVEEVVSYFKVPSVGHFTTPHRKFAYCVETEWAYKKVKEALQQGVTLTAAEKTRLLDEMYVF